MLHFRYKKEIDRSGKAIFRPIADVWFKTSMGGWIELHPYIDSGADISLVPFSFGKLLGWKKIALTTEQIGGIGGSIEVLPIKWPIKIGPDVLIATIGWAQDENVPALLGRQNIFDFFEIRFRQKTKEILFKKI